jgi:hypothetical protein
VSQLFSTVAATATVNCPKTAAARSLLELLLALLALRLCAELVALMAIAGMATMSLPTAPLD